jgi:hypothetical protein
VGKCLAAETCCGRLAPKPVQVEAAAATFLTPPTTHTFLHVHYILLVNSGSFYKKSRGILWIFFVAVFMGERGLHCDYAVSFSTERKNPPSAFSCVFENTLE